MVGTARLGIILVLIACLCGCGSSSAERDMSARAVLDYSRTRIALPVSEYIMSPEQWLTISKARERAFGLCMIPKGFPETPPKAVADDEDRFFGLWNVDNARKYGHGFAPQATISEPSSDPAWQVAREQCVASEEKVVSKFTPDVSDQDPGKVASDSQYLASQDPAWKAGRDKWGTCLRENGLEPEGGDSSWGSKQGSEILGRMDQTNPSATDLEADIRVAVIEATCNQQTHLTQSLGDLIASYEAPLVKKKQAILNAIKQKNIEYVKAATEYLATH